MSRLPLLLAAVLLAPTLQADTLIRSDDTRTPGDLVDVRFVSGGITGVYARKVVDLIQLSPKGDDLLILSVGGTRKGRLMSVRFDVDGKTVTVARDALRAIQLSSSTDPAPPEPQPKKPTTAEPAADERAARTKALKTNLAMRNHFWDEVDELKKKDYEALKAAYMPQATAVQRDIDRLRKAIADKERRRKEDERRWRDEQLRAQRNGGSTRNIPRPNTNDGLEQDERSLRDAEARKRKLKSEIDGEQSKIAQAATLTRRRVESVYGKAKIALEKGNDIPPDELRKHYQAALDAHQAYKK